MRFVRATRHGSSRRKVLGGVLVALILAVLLCLCAAACSNVLAEAQTLEGRGDLDGALALYERLLKKEPDNVKAL